MTTCYNCGGEITFRTREDGLVYPIHITGGCGSSTNYSSGKSIRTATYSYKKNQEDFCVLTKCPKCFNEVFFIRHNGGCLWVDKLGYPWPKHNCFEDDFTRNFYKSIHKTIKSRGFAILGRVVFIEKLSRRDQYVAVMLGNDGGEWHFQVTCSGQPNFRRDDIIFFFTHDKLLFHPTSGNYSVSDILYFDTSLYFNLRNSVYKFEHSYKCTICSKTFENQSKIRSHIYREHNSIISVKGSYKESNTVGSVLYNEINKYIMIKCFFCYEYTQLSNSLNHFHQKHLHGSGK